MTGELYSFDAWRSEGQRRRPTKAEIHAGNLKLAREELGKSEESASYYEAQISKLQRRLESNLTTQGKNRGKPLSETRRLQLQSELARKQLCLVDCRQTSLDLKRSISELEKGSSHG